MKVLLLCVATLVLVAPYVRGQTLNSGTCPTPTVNVKDFTTLALAGRWFDFKKYFSLSATGTCISFDIAEKDKANGLFSIDAREFIPLLATYKNFPGTAKVASTDKKEAIFGVSFPTLGGVETKYFILAANTAGADGKEKFIVLWSCTDFLLSNFQAAWVLTGDKAPSAAAVTAIDKAFTDNKLSTTNLQLSIQSPCP